MKKVLFTLLIAGLIYVGIILATGCTVCILEYI